jgi:hypothetical protein
MKLVAILSTTLLLVGCESLNSAGNAHYSVQPFEASNGTLHCCKVDVKNGKEMAYLRAHISMGKDGEIVVDLEEKGVAAFEGQRIASIVAQDSIDAAITAGMIAGGVMIAPLAAGALAGGALPAAAAGAAVGAGVTK